MQLDLKTTGMSFFFEKLSEFIVFLISSSIVELSEGLEPQPFNTLKYAWIGLSPRSVPKQNKTCIFEGKMFQGEKIWCPLRFMKIQKRAALRTLC